MREILALLTTLCIILFIGNDRLAAQGGELETPFVRDVTSTPTLLLPLAPAGDSPAVSLLLYDTNNEPLHYGAAYSFWAGTNVRITAKAALGHEAEEPRISGIPAFLNDDAGWYPAAGMHAAWLLDFGRDFGLAALAGIQTDYLPGSRSVWRLAVPVGARTEFNFNIGQLRISPAAALGFALRHDFPESIALTTDGATTTTGWFLDLSMHLALGPVWLQFIWDGGSRFGGRAPAAEGQLADFVDPGLRVREAFRLGVSMGG